MSDGNMSANYESEAHQKLLDDILTGDLLPNSRLKIRDLADRYDIGATPLREALSRLVPGGLVKFEQNKGFRVASLSLLELAEITEMRQIVEAEAFRRSVKLGDDAWESEVVASHHRLNKSISAFWKNDRDSRQEFENRHRAFHKVLASACGNSRLRQSVETLHQHLIRYSAIFLHTEIGGPELRSIHDELMRVVIERDAEAAHFVMRRHVRVNVDQVKEGLRANPELKTLIEDDLRPDIQNP